MTAIIGLLHTDGVLVGSDSLVLDEDQRGISTRNRDGGKARRMAGLIIGAAGDGRLCDVALGLKVPACRGPIAPWVRAEYTPRLWDALACKPTVEIALAVLFASATEIVTFNEDGSPFAPLGRYAAIGCGAPYALGSLWTSAGLQWSARERVTSALSAAANHQAAVGSPWVFLELRR